MGLRSADEAFLNGLRDVLGEKGWRAPADAPEIFAEDRDRVTGHGALVARPETTAEVAEIVKRCAEARVPLIPVSGGTGLVCGHVTVEEPKPVMISLQRMNRIRHIDAGENVLIAEAGAVLQDVQEAARGVERLFPLSLAAEGSCQIGGNLSTNAGGVNTLRYGNARDLCLGVEAVLPDGTIFNGLKRLRKDNMGYDLRHLLIGAEGTLGVITAAALRLCPLPKERATAWLAVANPAGAVALLNLLRGEIGEVISAFELIDRCGTEFQHETGMGRPDPLSPMPKWSVLVECGGQEGVKEAFEKALEKAFAQELISDGVVAQSETQAHDLWMLRENIPLANRAVGAISSHDISVPVASLPAFIEKANAAIAAFDPALRINCFGHAGDGNLHYNIYPPKGGDRNEYHNQAGEVKHLVHELTHEMEGSVSAEHGVGRLKTGDMERYGDAGLVMAMRAIKSALDPHGIMNPGAVLARR